MKTYLEYKDDKSSKFWEVLVEGNNATVRYGKIGTKGTAKVHEYDSPEKAIAEAEKLAKSKIKKGYANPETIKASSSETVIPNNPTPRIITEEEVNTKVNLADYDPIGNMGFEHVLFFEGDLHIKGDLDEEWVAKEFEKLGEELEDYTLVFILGNLTVEGKIAPGPEGNPCLFVEGDVRCDVLSSYDELITITGDAYVTYAIDGNYNHGVLQIEGTAFTPYMLNSDHHMEVTPSETTITINYYGDYDDFFEYDYSPKDFDRVMVKQVINLDGDEYRLDQGKFIELLKKGKSPLKRGAKTDKQIFEQELNKLTKKGDISTITELDLTDKKLKAFPKQILGLTHLKVLKLSKNDLKTLPPEIEKLENLEELYLEECSLVQLPMQLGSLKNLRILDVSRNYQNEYLQLPNAIGQLTRLQVLKVNGNQGFGFNDSLTKLKNLQSIEAYGCSKETPIDFPKVLTKITSLRALELGNNVFKNLEGILQLQNLEELNLNSSLCYLKDLSDLSKLEKLKILHANGLRSYTFRPNPKQSLIAQLMHITSLEELSIDRHGESEEAYRNENYEALLKAYALVEPEHLDLFKSAMKKVGKKNIWKGIERPALSASYLKDIGNLKNLKSLDLSFNDLTNLPEGIFELENIESINLSYSRDIPDQELKRLYESFPNAKIIAKKIRTRVDIDDENFRMVNGLVKEGNEEMRSYKYEAGITKFKEALLHCKPGHVFHEYDQLYAHYGIVYCTNHSLSRTEDADKRTTLLADIWQYGEVALNDLVPKDGLIWHYTEEGAFQEECIRYIGNVIAWLTYTDIDDAHTLEKALSYVQRSIGYLNGEKHDYINDTYVRLLLKLGQQEEAFKVVHKVLFRNPNFKDFKDFKKDKDYKKWAKAYSS